MLSNAGKTFESPSNCKAIKPVNPKGNHPWIFIGRTDAKAEAPILLPPDAKSRLTGKHPDAGKDWRQKEKGWQSMRWFESITDSMDMNMSKLRETMKDREAWHAYSPWGQRAGNDLVNNSNKPLCGPLLQQPLQINTGADPSLLHLEDSSRLHWLHPISRQTMLLPGTNLLKILQASAIREPWPSRYSSWF